MPLLRTLIYLLTFCLLFGLIACQSLDETLEDLSGEPKKDSVSKDESQSNASVPAGTHLFCTTNIGQTLVVYSLDEQRLLPNTHRRLLADPTGPWFFEDRGYYLSRVASDGSGQNALVEFAPQSLKETRRLQFPPNSNPNQMLILPQYGVAWITLTGSTFDDWASNGMVMIDLNSLEQVDYFNLNEPQHFINGERITSMDHLLYDEAKQQIYVIATNWFFEPREGWLFVFSINTEGSPQFLDTFSLGINPQGPMVLDAEEELWVVNNGGFAEFSGHSGTLDILDTKNFFDNIEGNEQIKRIEIGGDPIGIYQISEDEAWITLHPNDELNAVHLRNNEVSLYIENLPRITGPLFSTSDSSLFTGMGGFGHASLGRVDPEASVVLEQLDLQAGNGAIDCAEYVIQ